MGGINPWAVLVAAGTTFMLGGLWYSPVLFLKPWREAAGREPVMSGPILGLSAVFALVAALAFAWWLGPRPPLGFALLRGFIAGGCIAAPSFGATYLFSARPMKLWLIDGGYHTVRFMLFGLVLGLWH